MSEPRPLDVLRETVEKMLIDAGFEVLDIVTQDLTEDGETEWIVGPHGHYLYLSNNFGKMLIENPESARVPIEDEIGRLRKRVFGGNQ